MKNNLSEIVDEQKYRQKGETYEEKIGRLSATLADYEEHRLKLKDIFGDKRFLPAGRIQAAIGAARVTTPYNCFVSGTIKDDFDDIMDKVKEAGQTMRKGGGIGYDFCLAPGTFITTPKGCKKVEDLVEGEEVIGFPEDINLQKNVFEPAYVESNKLIKQPSYEIVTDQGTITASADHLFVARTRLNPKKKGEGFRWVKVKDLKVDNQIAFTTDPWVEKDESNSWLAGMFDGEGWSTSTYVGIAQNEGPVAERVRKCLYKLGVKYREHKYRDCVSFVPKGTWEAFKLLSILRPERFSWSVYGKKLCGKSSKPANILEVNYVGEREVWATRTTTKTLIANGFLSHNSTLRPNGDIIRSLHSTASGPISFMEVYDATCSTVLSAGHRRGAQMAVLRVDHPDIEDFIHAKQNSNKLTNFNISVGITNKFMEAVKAGGNFDLVFEGRVYKTVNARALWDTIMRSTWDWAEPGVLFLDRINRKNNLWYEETIAATNPLT